MKNSLLTTLRDPQTSYEKFRRTTNKLALIMASEIASKLKEKAFTIQTPLAKATGAELEQHIVLVPILRSGLALLQGFLRFFEEAPIGFLGCYRDEKTFQPVYYYEKLPPLKNALVILLDPMIATGGSAIASIERLLKKGAKEEEIILSGVLGSPEGVEALKKRFPKVTLSLVAIDEKLTKDNMISPGLGDFGDRFFATDQSPLC